MLVFTTLKHIYIVRGEIHSQPYRFHSKPKEKIVTLKRVYTIGSRSLHHHSLFLKKNKTKNLAKRYLTKKKGKKKMTNIKHKRTLNHTTNLVQMTPITKVKVKRIKCSNVRIIRHTCSNRTRKKKSQRIRCLHHMLVCMHFNIPFKIF